MNRRSFLVRLGQAATAAAAAAEFLDPERLLWTPGQKTIVDFGATKQVLPATDAEVISHARNELLFAQGGRHRIATAEDLMPWQKVERDLRLDIPGEDGQLRSFTYRGDQLVGVYSESDLRLLDKPFGPRPTGTPRAGRRRDTNWSLIDVDVQEDL